MEIYNFPEVTLNPSSRRPLMWHSILGLSGKKMNTSRLNLIWCMHSEITSCEFMTHRNGSVLSFYRLGFLSYSALMLDASCLPTGIWEYITTQYRNTTLSCLYIYIYIYIGPWSTSHYMIQDTHEHDRNTLLSAQWHQRSASTLNQVIVCLM